jgi:hypothetical protein
MIAQYFAFSQNCGSSVPVPDQTSKHDASKRYKLTIVIVDRTVTERDGKERFKLPAENKVIFLETQK